MSKAKDELAKVKAELDALKKKNAKKAEAEKVDKELQAAKAELAAAKAEAGPTSPPPEEKDRNVEKEPEEKGNSDECKHENIERVSAKRFAGGPPEKVTYDQCQACKAISNVEPRPKEG